MSSQRVWRIMKRNIRLQPVESCLMLLWTQSTGKQLLQNGNLRRRVTIIPLNKIQSHTVPSRVQQAAARKVGKENAEVALSLVGYEEELKPDPAIKKSSVMPRAINMHSMLLRSH